MSMVWYSLDVLYVTKKKRKKERNPWFINIFFSKRMCQKKRLRYTPGETRTLSRPCFCSYWEHRRHLASPWECTLVLAWEHRFLSVQHKARCRETWALADVWGPRCPMICWFWSSWAPHPGFPSPYLFMYSEPFPGLCLLLSFGGAGGSIQALRPAKQVFYHGLHLQS